MLREINEYTNEVVIGRVAKVEDNGNRVSISLVENYDQKDAEPNWVNVTAFDNDKVKTAQTIISLNQKLESGLKSCVLVMGVKKSENGQYTNRTLNWFKIVQFPKRG